MVKINGWLATFLVFGVAASAFSAERHIMPPRVPADKLAEARGLTSPLPDTPDVVEKGKALYAGKGTCMNCHGQGGGGDGPAAASLDPSPRNFQHHGFWRHRTEGEIFWVIKHGSVGTSMIGFGDQLTDEEIWAIIRYERSFAGEQGHRMGPGGSMGHMGTHQGMGGCKAEDCDR